MGGLNSCNEREDRRVSLYTGAWRLAVRVIESGLDHAKPSVPPLCFRLGFFRG